MGEYDAISITCSRSEQYETTVFVGATSAFSIIRELDLELLLRISLRGILEDMSEYEGKKYNGKHVQKDHW